MKKPSLKTLKIISIILGIAIPLALLLSAVRLVLTESFVQLEYQTPNFPADSYGMSQQERMQYGPLALAYLLNNDDISYLADQTFSDGSLLYNERELSHMEDVKELTQVVLKVWYGLLLGLSITAMWSYRADWHQEFRIMLSNAGKITLALLAGLLFFAALSFNAFFTGFHSIFFEGDTWLFLFSDTLIRLFPIRFWRDVVFVIGGLTVFGGIVLWRVFLDKKKPA
jgi:integral membrane protein (TIGR01906 family)